MPPQHLNLGTNNLLKPPDSSGSSLVTPPLLTPPCVKEGFGFGFPVRPPLARSGSSLSVASAVSSDDDGRAGSPPTQRDLDDIWSKEEEAVLQNAFEDHSNACRASGTPYTGLPPGQVLHTIARTVVQRHHQWDHSLASTRAKLLDMARVRQESDPSGFDIEATPRIKHARSSGALNNSEGNPPNAFQNVHRDLGAAMPTDYEATPRKRIKRRAQLQRQDSMTGVPTKKDIGTLNRLSDQLHNVEEQPQQPSRPSRRGAMERSYTAMALNPHPPSAVDQPPNAHNGISGGANRPLARGYSDVYPGPSLSVPEPPSISSVSMRPSASMPGVQSQEAETAFNNTAAFAREPRYAGVGSHQPSLVVEDRSGASSGMGRRQSSPPKPSLSYMSGSQALSAAEPFDSSLSSRGASGSDDMMDVDCESPCSSPGTIGAADDLLAVPGPSDSKKKQAMLAVPTGIAGGGGSAAAAITTIQPAFSSESRQRQTGAPLRSPFAEHFPAGTGFF